MPAAKRTMYAPRTTADPSAPPTTEMVTKSRKEIDRRPKAVAEILARAASQIDDENVVTTATNVFW